MMLEVTEIGWIESHSNATSQFYSIIEYPVEGGIYKTVSGEYIADVGRLVQQNPITLLTTSNKPYDFNYNPTGVCGRAVYYQDSKGGWFRDAFNIQ